MHLKYDETNTNDDSIATVLLRPLPPYRAELHIKRRCNNTFMLVCISGCEGTPPSKLKAQGPYHSLLQTCGARNAIVNALFQEGYSKSNEHPCWELHAQAFANNSREAVSANIGDYGFDPKDVF